MLIERHRRRRRRTRSIRSARAPRPTRSRQHVALARLLRERRRRSRAPPPSPTRCRRRRNGSCRRRPCSASELPPRRGRGDRSARRSRPTAWRRASPASVAGRYATTLWPVRFSRSTAACTVTRDVRHREAGRVRVRVVERLLRRRERLVRHGREHRVGDLAADADGDDARIRRSPCRTSSAPARRRSANAVR